MFCAGSGVRTPSGSWSYCMNTRFQYSRKRSPSEPGSSSAPPNSEPAVEVELAARPARARSGRPARSCRSRPSGTIRSRGTPTDSQASIASWSGPRPSASSPSKTVTQIDSGVEAEAVEREVPRELDGALLEVVADREVAEHLEEREVPVGAADVVDVDRAEALLRGRQPRRRRLLGAEEVGLERMHARADQQRGRIVARDERRRRQPLVPALGEVGEEALADLVGRHVASESRLARRCPPRASRRPGWSTRTAGCGCTRTGSSAPTAPPGCTPGWRSRRPR